MRTPLSFLALGLALTLATGCTSTDTTTTSTRTSGSSTAPVAAPSSPAPNNMSASSPAAAPSAAPSAAASTAAQAAPPAQMQGWVVYKPKDGTFSVEFPGKPQESGDSTTHTVLFEDPSKVVYMVAYTDVPKTASFDDKQALEFLHNTATALGKTKKVLSTKEGKLAGKPSLAIEFEQAPGFVMKSHAFLFQGRLYQAVTAGSKDVKDAHRGEIRHFYQSITINNKSLGDDESESSGSMAPSSGSMAPSSGSMEGSSEGSMGASSGSSGSSEGSDAK